MNKIFLFILTVCVFTFSTVNSEACSVFSVKNSNGIQVSKNFDWYVGEGVITINPRGVHRIQALKTDGESVKWVSKYGSLSFTAIAPGFPVSGMNEQGLVVESLHNVDFGKRLKEGKSLTSLEWVQYVLDNFENVKDVESFAKSNHFGQLIIPLHFFISDSKGNIIIVSGQHEHVNITRLSKNDPPVLANNRWRKDNRKYQKSLSNSWWDRLFSGNTNTGRFGLIASVLKKNAIKDSDDIFKLLNASRIPSLTKWQIIWNQTNKAVEWRHFRAGSPQKISFINFSKINFTCSSTIKVANIQRSGVPVFTNYGVKQIQQTAVRLRKIELKTGGYFPPQLPLSFAKHNQCE